MQRLLAFTVLVLLAFVAAAQTASSRYKNAARHLAKEMQADMQPAMSDALQQAGVSVPASQLEAMTRQMADGMANCMVASLEASPDPIADKVLRVLDEGASHVSVEEAIGTSPEGVKFMSEFEANTKACAERMLGTP